MLWTIAFWKGTGERALKTFAQSLAAGLIVATPVSAQPWLPALGIAVSATVLSVLTSVFSADFVAGEDRTDNID